jgi:ankyrin repeat protein
MFRYEKFCSILHNLLNLDILRYVLQLYPKRINIQNDEHKTPLHLAANLGDITICKVLIECGARVNSIIQTSAVS